MPFTAMETRARASFSSHDPNCMQVVQRLRHQQELEHRNDVRAVKKRPRDQRQRMKTLALSRTSTRIKSRGQLESQENETQVLSSSAPPAFIGPCGAVLAASTGAATGRERKQVFAR